MRNVTSPTVFPNVAGNVKVPRLKTWMRIIVPAILTLLALLPPRGLHTLLFEILAYPLPLPEWSRYVDKPFLNQAGMFLVAVIWAAAISLRAHVVTLLVHTMKNEKNRA
jgi:hypothetical protein